MSSQEQAPEGTAEAENSNAPGGHSRLLAATKRTLVTLAPLLALAFFFQVDAGFYGLYNPSAPALKEPLHWQETDSSLALVVDDFLGRFSLYLSAAAILFVWLCLVGICLAVIWQSTRHRQRWLRILVAFAPFAFAEYLLIQAWLGKDWILIKLPRQLIEGFFRGAELLTVECCLSGIITSALIFLVFSHTALLVPVDEADSTRLRERNRWLEILLWAGATILIVGVMHINLLLSWSASFLGEGDAEIVDRLIVGYSALIGFRWTIILGAIYVPTAMLLNRQAWSLACSERSTEEKRLEWLKTEDLAPSTFKRLRSIVVVLSPLLAGGPVTAVLNLFTS